MTHHETIRFQENSRDLNEDERGRLNPHEHRIYSKTRTILSTAHGLRRALTELQESCKHPADRVHSMTGSSKHQCVLCGLIRFRSFGS